MEKTRKKSVLILYNQTGEDEYEKLKEIDPKTLDFSPVYKIDVATVAEEYEAVAKALKSEGFRVKLLNINDDHRKLIRTLNRSKIDVIFNLVEYYKDDPELEASVAGVLDLYDIPYTGAPPAALILCQRKGFAKQILSGHDIPTPRFRMLHQPTIPMDHGLNYPLIVKPAREDASMGVTKNSVVYNYESLSLLVGKVYTEFSPPVLVEEFIEGRELHISILGNDPPRVLPAIEFDFSDLPEDHPPLISYEIKWSPLDSSYHQVHTICPAPLSGEELKKVEEAAVPAYTITGCRDYARIDMRMNSKGEVFVLEVNPNPDLTEGVSFMESAEEAGMTFSGTLREIVKMALSRTPGPPRAVVPDTSPQGITLELPPPVNDPELPLQQTDLEHPPQPEESDHPAQPDDPERSSAGTDPGQPSQPIDPEQPSPPTDPGKNPW